MSSSGDLTVRGKLLQTETEDLVTASSEYGQPLDLGANLWSAVPANRTQKKSKPHVPAIAVSKIVRDTSPKVVTTAPDLKAAISTLLKSAFWICIYAGFFLIALVCIFTLEVQNRAQLK